MISFALMSSLYDGLTFVVLLRVLRADQAQLRTGWFVESVVSASMIVLVVRSRGPFWSSRPSRGLALATVAEDVATLLLPVCPVGPLFGFVPLPLHFYRTAGPDSAGLQAHGRGCEGAFLAAKRTLSGPGQSQRSGVDRETCRQWARRRDG
jgi:hypothetical protein